MEDEKGAMEKMRLRMAAEGYSTLSDQENPKESDSAMKKNNSKWTRTEKQLVVLLFICFIVVLLLAVLLVVNFIMLRRTKTCDDVDCVEVSGSVIRLMNLSVNPCENYYQFACGNYDNVLTIPPDKPKYSQFSVLADKNAADLKRLLDEKGSKLFGVDTEVVTKVKNYYRACMNMSATDARGTEPLLKIMREMGSWSLTPEQSGTWDPDKYNLQNLIMSASNNGVDVLFGWGVGTDDKDSNMQLIIFDQEGLTFDRDHYLDQSREVYLAAFTEYFSKIIELLGGDPDKAKTRANDIFQFEAEVAKIQIPKEERRDQEKLYHKVTVKEVQENIGDWVDLKALLKSGFLVDIPDDEVVLNYVPRYLEKLQAIVEKQPHDLLADYVMWHVVSAHLSYMPSQFRDATLILSRALSGVDTLTQRWQICVGRTEGVFPYVTGAMYIEKQFSADDKETVEDILQSIITEFGHNIPTLDWMDKNTKERAVDKLHGVGHKIGYSDISKDIPRMEEYYSAIKVTPDNQLENSRSVLARSFTRMRAKRGNPPAKWEWSMSAETVNAYYSPTLNEMVFPAGILKAPFYDKKFPHALNFGAIGMVMGHELTHGFDDQGRQFDKAGNLDNWWEDNSLQNFKKKTECINKQYSAHSVGGIHVNGAFTMGENLADNGGLKTAYKAYQRWLKNNGKNGREPRARLPGIDLTEEQLFFLGFSQIWCYFVTPTYAKKAIVEDPHSPSHIRVLATLSNMKEFAEAYKCSPTAPMNPEHKCEVW